LVSFFHGSNDGQKGVGLFMLILIVFVPAKFALNQEVSNDRILSALSNTEQTVGKQFIANPENEKLLEIKNLVIKAKASIEGSVGASAQLFKSKKQLQSITKEVKGLLKNKEIAITEADRSILKTASDDLGKATDYAPIWVIAAISVALGFGTMIGWKRIVLTIGEKIGKEHLNYAQGASAELVAATTIGLSTGLGLPVSTTHVLSSGVAGAMVASNGTKNLNKGTLKNIALAWVLTLPVTILLSLGLFYVFHFFV
jgi:PiT family inorganic phosphate transporter